MADAPATGIDQGADVAGALLSGALKKLGIGGGSNASSSTASNAVSVNPVIYVAGGSGAPVSGAYAPVTSSPAANATAQTQPPGWSSYGPGAGVAPLAEVDLGQARPAGGGLSGLLDSDFLLIAAAGFAAFMFLKKGK